MRILLVALAFILLFSTVIHAEENVNVAAQSNGGTAFCFPVGISCSSANDGAEETYWNAATLDAFQEINITFTKTNSIANFTFNFFNDVATTVVYNVSCLIGSNMVRVGNLTTLGYDVFTLFYINNTENCLTNKVSLRVYTVNGDLPTMRMKEFEAFNKSIVIDNSTIAGENVNVAAQSKGGVAKCTRQAVLFPCENMNDEDDGTQYRSNDAEDFFDQNITLSKTHTIGNFSINIWNTYNYGFTTYNVSCYDSINDKWVQKHNLTTSNTDDFSVHYLNNTESCTTNKIRIMSYTLTAPDTRIIEFQAFNKSLISADNIPPAIAGELNKTINVEFDEVINVSFKASDETGLDSGIIAINDTGFFRFFNFSLNGVVNATFSQAIKISCGVNCAINLIGIVNDTSNNIIQESILIIVADITPPLINVSYPLDNSVINKTRNNLTINASCFDYNVKSFYITGYNSSDKNNVMFNRSINTSFGYYLNLSFIVDLTNISVGNYSIEYNCKDIDSVANLTNKIEVIMRQESDVTGGIISGTVFNDNNKNRKRDLGETGISNWTIFIDANKNFLPDNNEQRVKTNSLGEYFFENLQNGTYIIRQVLKKGYFPTSPLGYTYKLKINTTSVETNKDFGNKRIIK